MVDSAALVKLYHLLMALLKSRLFLFPILAHLILVLGLVLHLWGGFDKWKLDKRVFLSTLVFLDSLLGQ